MYAPSHLPGQKGENDAFQYFLGGKIVYHDQYELFTDKGITVRELFTKQYPIWETPGSSTTEKTENDVPTITQSSFSPKEPFTLSGKHPKTSKLCIPSSTIHFDSSYDSGNLKMAIQNNNNPTKYSLILHYDGDDSTKSCGWYFFCIFISPSFLQNLSQPHPSALCDQTAVNPEAFFEVQLEVLNLSKPDSLHNKGQKPFTWCPGSEWNGNNPDIHSVDYKNTNLPASLDLSKGIFTPDSGRNITSYKSLCFTMRIPRHPGIIFLASSIPYPLYYSRSIVNAWSQLTEWVQLRTIAQTCLGNEVEEIIITGKESEKWEETESNHNHLDSEKKEPRKETDKCESQRIMEGERLRGGTSSQRGKASREKNRKLGEGKNGFRLLPSLAYSPSLPASLSFSSSERETVKSLLTADSVRAIVQKVLTITKRKKIRVVLTSRIHAGETHASYVLQGLVNEILSKSIIGRALRCLFEFSIIPIMNPDGVWLGNHRGDALGRDLNRLWAVSHDSGRDHSAFSSTALAKTNPAYSESLNPADISYVSPSLSFTAFSCVRSSQKDMAFIPSHSAVRESNVPPEIQGAISVIEKGYHDSRYFRNNWSKYCFLFIDFHGHARKMGSFFYSAFDQSVMSSYSVALSSADWRKMDSDCSSKRGAMARKEEETSNEKINKSTKHGEESRRKICAIVPDAKEEGRTKPETQDEELEETFHVSIHPGILPQLFCQLCPYGREEHYKHSIDSGKNQSSRYFVGRHLRVANAYTCETSLFGYEEDKPFDEEILRYIGGQVAKSFLLLANELTIERKPFHVRALQSGEKKKKKKSEAASFQQVPLRLSVGVSQSQKGKKLQKLEKGTKLKEKTQGMSGEIKKKREKKCVAIDHQGYPLSNSLDVSMLCSSTADFSTLTSILRKPRNPLPSLRLPND